MAETFCKICEKPTDDGAKYCSGICYRERENFASRNRARRFSPERKRATHLVATALLNKSLIPQPCETCGSLRFVEAHHDDYAQPLAIRWLCKSHHKRHHLAFGPGKNAYRVEDAL